MCCFTRRKNQFKPPIIFILKRNGEVDWVVSVEAYSADHIGVSAPEAAGDDVLWIMEEIFYLLVFSLFILILCFTPDEFHG